jgi:hypothetical protein
MSGIDIVTTNFGIGMTAILFSFSILLLSGTQQKTAQKQMKASTPSLISRCNSRLKFILILCNDI